MRLVHITRQLSSDQQVEEIRQIARTASENGLNVVLFAGLDSIESTVTSRTGDET